MTKPTKTPTILTRILDHKRQEVLARRENRPESELTRIATGMPPGRGFHAAIAQRVEHRRAAVIAEIKKASPSKGVIRADFHPAAIATDYAAGGAACLSVLTDETFFQGSAEFLEAARNACQLPVLRKDFIVDAWQIHESRVLGADCILLIASALSEHDLADFNQIALDIGLDVLIEVHNLRELDQANRLKAPLIGVNNRNLHTFETSLATTIDLLAHTHEHAIIVTESGIHSPDDVKMMMDADVYAFLVGEAFMRAPSPGAKLGELFRHRL